MGLFDMFGAGGGSLQIQPTAPHAASGSAIGGNLVFMGGSRAQNITKLTLRLTMEETQMQMTNQGMRPHTSSRELVPATVIAQTFSSTPGQPSTFPFQLPVPPGLPSSTPNAVTYHLRASADIDGEIDPGTSLEINVVGTGPAAMPGAPMGGMPGAMPGGMPNAMGMMPGGMPGGMPGAPMGGMPNAMGMMPGGMPNAMPGGMPGAMGVTIANGTHVMAMWTDGQLHQATVRGFENGMYRVDWTDPRLGANGYVYPQQVQVMGPAMHAAPGMVPGMPGMAPGMPQQGMHPGKDMHAAKGMAPGGQQQGMHPGKDMHAAKGMHAGMQQQQQGMHAGKDMHAAKGMHPGVPQQGMHPGAGKDLHAKGLGSVGDPPGIGSPVMAQHPHNQQWYPGRVVAMQQGMVGVDWDDPSLGQSSWVSPVSVRSR